MKILVLGADGFVGRNVCLALGDQHDVYRGRRGQPVNDHDCQIDLTDLPTIIKALSDLRPEVIINCAGVVEHTERAQLNPLFTTNLLEAVLDVGLKPKRIIISGSAAEYGQVDPKNLPVSEDAPLNAEPGYAQAKLQETKLALEVADKHQLPVTIARIFNPIGAGMHPKFLIPKLIQQVQDIQAGARTSIEVSRLDAKRDYINVADVAQAIRLLAEKQPKQAVYNIGSGHSTSTAEIVELIVKDSKLLTRPEVIETSDQPEEPIAIQADSSRMQQEFGWQPQHTIAETIKEIIHATNN